MMAVPRMLGVGLAVLVCAVGLSACGEKKVTSYNEPGKYTGAPVTSPWDSPQYGGKKAEWEAALQARTQNQNDYARVPAK